MGKSYKHTSDDDERPEPREKHVARPGTRKVWPEQDPYEDEELPHTD